ncbi:cell adhesion molecule 3-like [Halyomorpha halys]|uniref:cell adhesion molecule 3 n=1 Tax=Halyomorpha halys TaxID=286706 RepID=UPI0006D5156E|nr:cell adhesion molecule 3 [Halyomorpha halys]XP_014286409.2 cell adhesion molecule 3-like [Halyomorpha halys]
MHQTWQFSMRNRMITRILCLLALLYCKCWCLNMSGISVPSYAVEGEEPELECKYQAEGDTLYGVKWYKGDEEFYRYIFRSNPPFRTYKVEGVTVSMNRSNSTLVVLKNIRPSTSGTYRCEVSAEAPSFHSATAEASMTVIYKPTTGPKISGQKEQYLIGDEVNLNCTSAESYPAARLTWHINDEQVQSVSGAFDHSRARPDLLVAVTRLKFRLNSRHIKNGRTIITCVSKYGIWPPFQDMEGPEENALTAPGGKDLPGLYSVTWDTRLYLTMKDAACSSTIIGWTTILLTTLSAIQCSS